MELDEAQSVVTPEAPKEMDPHFDTRMAVAAKMEERRLQEIAAAAPPAPEPEPEPERVEEAAQEPVEPVEEPPPAEVAAEPAQPPKQAAQPQLFPLQLPNGQVTYLTGDQLAYLAQRGAMAEMQPAPVQQQPAPVETPKPTHAANFDSEKARAVIKALAYGSDDDEGVRVLQEWAQSIVPQYDPDQSTRQALAQIRLENNLNVIGSEYPDVFRDTSLTQLAALKLDEIRRDPRSQQFSDLDLYREACNRVRRVVGFAAPQPQPETQIAPNPVPQAAQAAPSVRLERKRGAPSVPSASDRRLGAGDDTPRIPSNRDVINQIRAGRGQAPLE